jgi:hypothetical protein
MSPGRPRGSFFRSVRPCSPVGSTKRRGRDQQRTGLPMTAFGEAWPLPPLALYSTAAVLVLLAA